MALKVSASLSKVVQFVATQVLRVGKTNINVLTRFKPEIQSSSFFHTTRKNNDLMEFFDTTEDLEEGAVACGRPWRKDELRIKSNEDLHKLWYILLKERNRIMTLESELERQGLYMTDAWRMEKVEVSMENLLTVVKERDIALNMLETGLRGEPCEVTARNALGIKYRRVESEHLVPKYMNRKYRLLHSKYEPWMAQWILKYEEVKRVKQEKREKYYKYQAKMLQKNYGISEKEAIRSINYIRQKSKKMRDFTV